MAHFETYTIESLIAKVERLVGDKFVVVGSGKNMGLQLEGEGGDRPTFSPRGRNEIIRYLQGMIYASSRIAKR